MLFVPNKSLAVFTGMVLMYLNGFSLTDQKSDTTLKDITGNHFVKVPFICSDVRDFQVAVISLDSIGKKKLPWNENQQQFTKETEKEFEQELLSCSQGKDSSYSRTLVTKMKTYCRKTGYGDGGMGKLYDVNYVSFRKANYLIVFEFAVIWRNCQHGYEGEQIKICETEEHEKRIRVDSYIDKLVRECIIN